jgi:hypothetical protein
MWYVSYQRKLGDYLFPELTAVVRLTSFSITLSVWHRIIS